MAAVPLSQPVQIKNAPAKPAPIRNQRGEPPIKDVSKQSVPIWVIFLFLLLISIIVGMGIYIGFQQGFFQKRTPTTGLTETPTPTALAASQDRIAPGADWLTYRDEQAGFTLKYPPTVVLNENTKGVSTMALGIFVETIESISESLPLGMGRQEAIDDRTALEKGIAQTVGDWAASDALVRIGGKFNGRMTSVLSRFEVCSVIFSRKLVFYPGNYRVIIGLSGNDEQIMSDMPEFFTVDPTNCGEMKMWNRDGMGEFLPTFAKGQGQGAGQEWYDTFTAIINTITLIPIGQTTISNSPSPESTSACEVSDSAFCTVLADIKTSMEAKNFNGVIAYQTPMTVTCDPDGMAIAICEGAAKGTTKEGYSIGYNQSEGNVNTRDTHLASLASYVSENGPFIYKGSLQSGDKGVIVYLNGNASELFVLNMKRTGLTWRFQSILVGGTWGDDTYKNLDPSLLEQVR